MANTERLRGHIDGLLSTGPQSTTEILDYINDKLKHGTTSHVLGNLLSHDPKYKKVGTRTRAPRSDVVYHTYYVSIWALAE